MCQRFADGINATSDEKCERNPSRDWTLFNILSQDVQSLTHDFITEFCRLSGCVREVVADMLKDPSKLFLCYVHVNHSRVAQKKAFKALIDSNGQVNAVCLFRNICCSSPAHIAESRLWRVPLIDVHSPHTLELFSELEDAVCSHSRGMLHAADVVGKMCCRSCHYIVLQGKQSSNPPISIETLPLSIDRFIVRAIFFALEKSAMLSRSPLMSGNLPSYLSDTVARMRSSCIPSKGDQDGSVRLLPFQEVSRARTFLCAHGSDGERPDYCIDDRTLEKRIEGVLASKGIILKKLSYRLRCYVCVAQGDDMLSQFASSGDLPVCKAPRLSHSIIRSHFDSVCKRFTRNREFYWKGIWTLTEEIASIPSQLWTDTILQMASRRKLLVWNAAAMGLGRRLEDIFPVSNSPDVLPKPSIEEELWTGKSYSRADLIICVRTLKVIEQIVLSRSNGVAGPLTISVSVSGICEVTPSFVSVLNAMGMFLSYNVTERYRQGLIAERERCGPWNLDNMDEDCIPMLQFDNWDIIPLHAIKVDGKALPKVNGSLLQGTLKRKAHTDGTEKERKAKRTKKVSWKETSCIGDRDNFITSLTDIENAGVLKQFNNVVFGLVCLFRGQLIGGKEASKSEYNARTRADFAHGVSGLPLNFRTLLLSSFLPHGGRPHTDESLYEQHVVYVEISRDSAADIITVRRFLNMVAGQLRPGSPGCPRYIVLGGDQPSYKMFVELWLESWRRAKSRGEGSRDGAQVEPGLHEELHEWLIPFPGFFHAEKQAMYSLCKEMLDGLGLQELAACSGLSPSHVDKFLKHSHARNNRAVLFNLASAMIIHLIDLLLVEDGELSAKVANLHRAHCQKHVSIDADTVGTSSNIIQPQQQRPKSSLYGITSDLVSPDIIRIGELLRERVESRFSAGPNGKHFVDTVLFSCLLPTVGFHVLPRTGHTDLVPAFWFKHNAILHSSTHLKYQELSLFFAFFRGILPSVVTEELFTRKPGRMVMKLLIFTGRGRFGIDRWGFWYTHVDEALEMLIVRHLKSLSVNFLGHLEHSAGWLMQVSMFRALTRYMTGASRAFGRKREECDGGENLGPLSQYDRTARQWKTVSRMVHVMRDAGFLNASHRGAEWLTNVFCNPPKRMTIKKDQDNILNIAESGGLTSKLHASVLFPDVFGPLTAQDRETHFGGHKFKKWTKCRAVTTAGKSMGKVGGSAICGDESSMLDSLSSVSTAASVKRPSTKEASSKVVLDRRRKISKLKDALHEEKRLAMRSGNADYVNQIMIRWDKLHAARHLLSPFADCFRKNEGDLSHGSKSRFLKYLTRGRRDTVFPMNDIDIGGAGISSVSNVAEVSRNLYVSGLPAYLTIQLDVMNALHYRGDTGHRGTALRDVITGKMKSVLRPWITGLRQVHLHIDDPSYVLCQKISEQSRRDRRRREARNHLDDAGSIETRNTHTALAFKDELNVPWSSLLVDREYKDELASLHLFCGAVAAFELFKESSQQCSVYLHGGCFVIPGRFNECSPSQLHAERVPQGCVKTDMKGRIVLSKATEWHELDKDAFTAPRSRCLIFHPNGTAEIGRTDLRHGEAETRFVAATMEYIATELSSPLSLSSSGQQTSFESSLSKTPNECQTVIVSDDTDVFMILLSNPCLYGRGVLHVLNDTIHHLDVAISKARSYGTCGQSIALLYCLAGCDFSPSIHGMAHEAFWRPFLLFVRRGDSLLASFESGGTNTELLLCFLYLMKHGKTRFCSDDERKRRIASEVARGQLDTRELQTFRKSFFASNSTVGSLGWRIDVRNFVADQCSTTNELMPHLGHIKLHWSRAAFVAIKYWGRSVEHDLSHSVLGGCDASNGYNPDGTVLLEMKTDVDEIMKAIRDVVISCNCSGDCSTRRCSCLKNGDKCVGCGCVEGVCKNRQIAICNGEAESQSLEVNGNDFAGAADMPQFEQDTGLDVLSISSSSDCSVEDAASVNSDEFEREDINDLT